jgi:hypothetical protein
MINANVVFWIWVALFALVGWMRGWQKEVIASASLVLAIFVLNFVNLNDRLVNFVQAAPNPGQVAQPGLLRGRPNITEGDRVKIERFGIMAIPFLLITFFGYLGPTVVRNVGGSTKLGDRVRVGIGEGLQGGLIGGINGYLIMSTLAYFAYRQGLLPDQGTFPLTVPNAQPPTTVLFQQLQNGALWGNQFFIESSAYVLLSGPTLIIALVVLFLFVIIAFI